jgi:uncharacterized membrane protein YeaQ/YmgE (transglycosylase-associated protein family)
MSLIIFLLVGLIAGALASYILGRQQDLLVNLLIGIIGAVVGGLLAGLLGLGAYNIIGEIIIATIGAIICILVLATHAVRFCIPGPQDHSAYMDHRYH